MQLLDQWKLERFKNNNASVRTAISQFTLRIEKSEPWYSSQNAFETLGAKRVKKLRNNRIRVAIKGGEIRCVLLIEYREGIAYVRWIGFHKDYDKIDPHTI